MAFCTKCGAQSTEGGAFCVTCGAPMTATPAPAAASIPAPPAGPIPAPPAAPVPAPGPIPTAFAPPATPSFLGALWAGLDLGAKVAGIGAAVAAISFFLPIYSGVNGVNMANGSGTEGAGDASWWFRLLLSLVAIGILYFYYNTDLRTKIIVATAHVAIGSLWGFAIFRITTGGDFTSGLQFGWYSLHFALFAIVVGGFMSILDLTKRLRGVH